MLTINCACGKVISVPEHLAGKKIRCKECRAVTLVKAPETSPPPPLPPSMRTRSMRHSGGKRRAIAAGGTATAIILLTTLGFARAHSGSLDSATTADSEAVVVDTTVTPVPPAVLPTPAQSESADSDSVRKHGHGHGHMHLPESHSGDDRTDAKRDRTERNEGSHGGPAGIDPTRGLPPGGGGPGPVSPAGSAGALLPRTIGSDNDPAWHLAVRTAERVDIYGPGTCPRTRALREELESAGIDFHFHPIEEASTRPSQVGLSGWNGVEFPVIVADGKVVLRQYNERRAVTLCSPV